MGKPRRMFEVRCRWCGNKQKIIIYDANPTGHWRKCTYCGKSFEIHKNIQDSCIIKEI